MAEGPQQLGPQLGAGLLCPPSLKLKAGGPPFFPPPQARNQAGKVRGPASPALVLRDLWGRGPVSEWFLPMEDESRGQSGHAQGGSQVSTGSMVPGGGSCSAPWTAMAYSLVLLWSHHPDLVGQER